MMLNIHSTVSTIHDDLENAFQNLSSIEKDSREISSIGKIPEGQNMEDVDKA